MGELAGDYPLLTIAQPQPWIYNQPSFAGGTSFAGGLTDMTMRAVTSAASSPIETVVPGSKIRIAAPGGKLMAKLIRYTVIDPDPVLVEERPDLCILLEGRRMLNGADEKGFLMDLASELTSTLATHNVARETVEYEDDEGRTKKLKPVRLGQLDVVVEELKGYPTS